MNMTVSEFDPNGDAVTMTAAAIEFFEGKLGEQPNKLIRLSTEVSGCTGYAYVLDWAESANDDDEILKPSAKITLAISRDALDVLRGTEIDLEKMGVNQVVKFNNPNVVAECGCGESFSVS